MSANSMFWQHLVLHTEEKQTERRISSSCTHLSRWSLLRERFQSCVIKTHSSCCNCSLFKAQCQLRVVMQTPVNLCKSHSGTNRWLSNGSINPAQWQGHQWKRFPEFLQTIQSLWSSKTEKPSKARQVKPAEDDAHYLGFNLLKASKEGNPLQWKG